MWWELGFEQRARNSPALLIQATHPALVAGAAEDITFWHGMMF
jgi:hypothetical protein